MRRPGASPVSGKLRLRSIAAAPQLRSRLSCRREIDELLEAECRGRRMRSGAAVVVVTGCPRVPVEACLSRSATELSSPIPTPQLLLPHEYYNIPRHAGLETAYLDAPADRSFSISLNSHHHTRPLLLPPPNHVQTPSRRRCARLDHHCQPRGAAHQCQAPPLPPYPRARPREVYV